MATLPPFHQGELDVQRLAKESHIAQRNGGVISDTILAGAIPFIAQQNMLLVSSLDAQGYVWTSVLMGRAGFISAQSTTSLLLDTRYIIKQTNDPLWQNIINNPQVGLLAIELDTRRRFRINGIIRKISQSSFVIEVEQAYPNCPKYIQRRSLKISDDAVFKPLTAPNKGIRLMDQQVELITTADSLFVGSASPTANDSKNRSVTGQLQKHGGDVSYRGGYPGFVEVLNGSRLRIPDYQGNSMFNTLGNIQAYPKAGIAFIDFDQGRLLQVSGRAKILWHHKDPSNKTNGTQRFWELDIENWQETDLPPEMDWHFFDYSPHNPRQQKRKAITKLNLKIQSIEDKSPTIKLFTLASEDGSILPTFEPGAHLPIELTLDDKAKIERHYSLVSSNEENRFYQIAVQREDNGRGGSMHLHQNGQVNTLISAKSPRNEFPLSPIGQHTILIAGGIGITPILSMLRALVDKDASFEIHYSAKTLADLAFKKEVSDLAGNKAHFYYSTGENAKRLDLNSVMQKIQNDSHVFLCGPIRLIETARNIGEILGINSAQIHFESFGASPTASDSDIEVTLKKSAMVVTVKQSQTILEALIEKNISVPYDCKRGECGMCAVDVIEGNADHRDVYLNKQERQTQMCVCVSRAKGKGLTLDL